jgi:hypothetical protein
VSAPARVEPAPPAVGGATTGRSQHDRQTEAARTRARRARRRRDELTRHTHCLAGVGVRPLPEHPTIGDVAAFYATSVGSLRALRNAHAEAFAADGWHPRSPDDPGSEQWTAPAALRVGLLLRSNPVAEEIRYHLGQGELPVSYATTSHRIRQCQALHERTAEIVEHVREESPAELWRDLNTADRYQLQALVIALAALIPVDQPNLAHWLIEMSATPDEKGSVVKGLAMLIPTPRTVDPEATAAPHHPGGHLAAVQGRS